MTRNEFKLKMTEIILNDWRQALLADDGTKCRVSLPGDVLDISWRAMQKANEIANDFYEPED